MISSPMTDDQGLAVGERAVGIDLVPFGPDSSVPHGGIGVSPIRSKGGDTVFSLKPEGKPTVSENIILGFKIVVKTVKKGAKLTICIASFVRIDEVEFGNIVSSEELTDSLRGAVNVISQGKLTVQHDVIEGFLVVTADKNLVRKAVKVIIHGAIFGAAIKVITAGDQKMLRVIPSESGFCESLPEYGGVTVNI